MLKVVRQALVKPSVYLRQLVTPAPVNLDVGHPVSD